MKIQKKVAILAGVLSVACASNVSAQTDIKKLEKRLAKLERMQKNKRSTVSKIAERVTMSGLIEIEAGYVRGYDKNSSSDIIVRRAKLGFEAQINDQVDAQISLLHEENETDLEVDIATLDIAISDALDVTLGQTYVPFGVFNTNLVNDTLILEMAETRETVAMASFNTDTLKTAVYTFNGNINDTSRDVVDSLGVSVGFEAESFYAGFDITNNALDSDGVQGFGFNKHVGGTIFNAGFNAEAFSLAFEYLLVDKVAGGNPSGLQLEAGFGFNDMVAAFGIQTTDDAQGLGLPKTRFSVGLNTEVMSSVSLGVELWSDKDYSRSKGGTGDTALGLVAQLAANF